MSALWFFIGASFMVAAILVFRLRLVIVHDHEAGLLFMGGRLRKTVRSGVYLTLGGFLTVRVIDTRAQAVTIPGQEILSADHVPLKVSTAIFFRVSEAVRAVQAAQSFQDALYLEAQIILRDLVSALPIDEVLAKREELGARLRERLDGKAAALGLTLETVALKDIMFPGMMKGAFTQVVEARKSAQAALEKARGETATLRSLANAAKLLEGNPALVTLKTLQAAGDGKNTVVLGLPQIPVLPLQGTERPPAP